jgi:hypothetical protein
MRRTIIGLAAAGAMAAGMATVPTQAHAVAPWVVPAIVAAGFAGVVVGAVAVQAGQTYAGDCRLVTVQAPDGTLQKVEVCNR